MHNYWPDARMAILVASSMCAPVSATLANTEPMTVVRQYVDAFNKGDAEAMAANCADPTRVLDGLAPHVWRGLQLAGGTGTCPSARAPSVVRFVPQCHLVNSARDRSMTFRDSIIVRLRNA
jgi:hypothetical protein